MKIELSEYFKYRTELRNFKLDVIADIIIFSDEKYFDTITHRNVVIGKHEGTLIIVPYEEENNVIRPITVHAIDRKQIKFRLKTGRFK